MANVTALLADDGSKVVSEQASLMAHLVEALRPSDEAVLLPGAQRSSEGAWFDNVLMTLDGSDPDVPPVFKPDWGSGISVVRVSAELAEPLLQSSEKRQGALQALANAIPNELTGDDDVGPCLGNSDSTDVQGDNWTAGFDSTTCCVGLYSATEQIPVAGGTEGMTRAHRSYFLVAKAGAGKAGQEFHQKFSSAVSNGTSLDGILIGGGVDASGTSISEGTIHRVNNAGRRNRARLILNAAKVLGLSPDVDSVPDHACAADAQQPVAILMADAVTNTLVRRSVATSDMTETSRWWYYAGAVAPVPISTGAVICSNVTEGMLLVLPPREGEQAHVRNDANGALPFGSPRIMSTLDAVLCAAKAHSQCVQEGDEGERSSCTKTAHPDGKWVSSHFSWKLAKRTANLEPPQLWGTHAPLGYERWARTAGLSVYRRLLLMPELVTLAGAEAPIVRAAVAKVQAAKTK